MEKLLGKKLYDILIARVKLQSINEIRLRCGKQALIKCFNEEIKLPYIVTHEDIDEIINVATNNSRYAYEQEMSDGFIEYLGGIRVGICGSGVINGKNLIAYSRINSLCIRIPHEITPKAPLSDIINNFDNTLIISPPYCGKTTLIRYMAKELSKKYDTVIIDERYEIAGAKLTMETGERADIVQGIPKTYVFEKIIRSMSPQIVVCDELFFTQDIEAVRAFISAGIKCLASFHAKNYEILDNNLKSLFNCIITLSSKPTVGSIASIMRKND